MVAFPPCKINLGLKVLHRRADGYHDIDTCFYPVPRTDILEVVPASEFSFTSSGLTITGVNDENICVKAYKLLQQEFDLPPAAIYLHKLIPAGAGLGGGSSDATWTLRTLNEVFDLAMDDSRLADYASRLGSDCPFFIHSTPMIGNGRGELLSSTSISLKGKYIVIVRPDIHVSTQLAYQAIVPDLQVTSIREIIETFSPEQWRDRLSNQFEPFVMKRYPAIARIRDDLYASGALYASMSGSGSAVFGLFRTEVNLAQAFTGYDCWSGWLDV
jgi:4-diphosphocytidyl-2-C-methyl-D-erythritol kinase